MDVATSLPYADSQNSASEIAQDVSSVRQMVLLLLTKQK